MEKEFDKNYHFKIVLKTLIEHFNEMVEDDNGFERFYVDPEFIKMRYVNDHIDQNDRKLIDSIKDPKEKNKLIKDYVKAKYFGRYISHLHNVKIRITQSGHLQIHTENDIGVIHIGNKLAFDHLPVIIDSFTGGGTLDVSSNELKSLVNLPKEVMGNFDCSHNELTTLEGGPTIVAGDYNCADNPLQNLNGVPQKINGKFTCSLDPEAIGWDQIPMAKEYHLATSSGKIYSNDDIKKNIGRAKRTNSIKASAESGTDVDKDFASTFADYMSKVT